MMISMPRLKRKLVLNSRPRSDFTMPKTRKLVRMMEAPDGGLGLDEGLAWAHWVDDNLRTRLWMR